MERFDYDIVELFKNKYKNEVAVLPEIPDTDTLYNGPLGRLSVPRTMNASIELTHKTDWCMNWTNPVDHDFYKHDSNIYIWTGVDQTVYGIYVDIATGKGKFVFQYGHTIFRPDLRDQLRATVEPISFLYEKIEEEILKDPTKCYRYVLSCVRSRWPKGEAIIFRDDELTKKYMRIIKRR